MEYRVVHRDGSVSRHDNSRALFFFLRYTGLLELRPNETVFGTLNRYCSVPEFQKTGFSDHGVSIPLRILTSSMLTVLSEEDCPFIYTITLLSILLYFLYFVLDLYINCVTWLFRLSFFLECMVVCVRVCEMLRGECSSES